MHRRTDAVTHIILQDPQRLTGLGPYEVLDGVADLPDVLSSGESGNALPQRSTCRALGGISAAAYGSAEFTSRGIHGNEEN